MRAGLLLVALGLTSCTSDGSDPSATTQPAGPADPIPVSAPDIAGPGARIAEGYTVPEGAVLLGGAIPKGIVNQAGDIDDGWDAYLVVSGDPRQVVEALVRQVEGGGFRLRSFALDRQRYPTGDVCGAVEDAYRCRLLGADSLDSPTQTLDIDYLRTTRPVPASWLHLSFSDADRPAWASAASEYDLPAIEGYGAAAPPLPSADAWHLPEVGDLVGEEVGEDDLYLTEIVPGSRAIAPSPVHRESSGYTLLVAVTGDLDEVVEAYLAQNDGEEYLDPVTASDGTLVRTYGAGGAGGSELTLTSVEPPDGPPFLRIEVGYD